MARNWPDRLYEMGLTATLPGANAHAPAPAKPVAVAEPTTP